MAAIGGYTHTLAEMLCFMGVQIQRSMGLKNKDPYMPLFNSIRVMLQLSHLGSKTEN